MRTAYGKCQEELRDCIENDQFLMLSEFHFLTIGGPYKWQCSLCSSSQHNGKDLEDLSIFRNRLWHFDDPKWRAVRICALQKRLGDIVDWDVIGRLAFRRAAMCMAVNHCADWIALFGFFQAAAAEFCFFFLWFSLF